MLNCRMLNICIPKDTEIKAQWGGCHLAWQYNLVNGICGTRFHVWLQSHTLPSIKCQVAFNHFQVAQMFQVISIIKWPTNKPQLQMGLIIPVTVLFQCAKVLQQIRLLNLRQTLYHEDIQLYHEATWPTFST